MTEEPQPIVLTCLNPWCTAPNQQFVQIYPDQFHCSPMCAKRKNGRLKRQRDKEKAADIVASLEQIIADQAAEIHRLNERLKMTNQD